MTEYEWNGEELEFEDRGIAEEVYGILEEEKQRRRAENGILGDTVGGEWYELDGEAIEIVAGGSGERRRARNLVEDVLEDDDYEL